MKYQAPRLKPLILLALAATFIVVFSCSNERDGFFARLFRGGVGTAGGIPVSVESVTSREQRENVAVPASVELSESADVTVPDDVTLERFLVNEGDAVRQGDVLARISEDEINLKLVRLRTDLREAQVKLEKNSYLFRNRDRLLEEDRIDRDQYDRLESDITANEAEVEKLRDDIANVERRMGEAQIVSPISGVVIRRHIANGETAQAGKPVLTVARIDPALISFRLDAEQAPLLKPGAIVKVALPAPGAAPLQASVTAVDAQIDPADRTFGVRAAAANPQGLLKAGMKVTAEFPGLSSTRTFVIPEEALIRDARGFFVFTVIQGKAHKVQVIPSQGRGDRMEIARGLTDEDVVVVRGQDKLTEGARVDIWGR